MIEERYCSYEVARLLKEKGFDEECHMWYEGEDDLIHTNDDYGLQTNSDHVSSYFEYAAPTHQMACDWLEQKYHLFFGLGFGNDYKGDFLYMVDIYDLTNDAVKGVYKPIVEADDYLTTSPKTVGDAIEAAIKYSLENLV